MQCCPLCSHLRQPRYLIAPFVHRLKLERSNRKYLLASHHRAFYSIQLGGNRLAFRDSRKKGRSCFTAFWAFWPLAIFRGPRVQVNFKMTYESSSISSTQASYPVSHRYISENSSAMMSALCEREGGIGGWQREAQPLGRHHHHREASQAGASARMGAIALAAFMSIAAGT